MDSGSELTDLEKKGMKFFWIAVAIIFVTATIIVSIRPYPNLGIIQAGDEGVAYYSVDINVFGAYNILDEKFFPYSREPVQYLGLEGKYAYIALTANSLDVDMIVSNPEILGVLSDNLTFKSSSEFLNTEKADLERMLQNTKNGFYGLPVSTNFDKISFNSDDYIVIMPKYLLFTDGQLNKIIKKLTTVYD